MYKTFFLRRAILVIVVLLIYSPNLHSQDMGFKYFTNYSFKDYDHQPQNWGMTQAKNGVIYVANQGGVLEFDGVSWRVIRVPGYDPVRSIAIDKTGTIFVGGNNKIGFLEPDAKGTLQYVSMVDSLKDKYKDLGVVWKTITTKDGIFFRTSKYFFKWDYKKLDIVLGDDRVWGSFTCGDELYLFRKKSGLVKMVNGSPVSMQMGESFKSVKRIIMIVGYDQNRLLIRTWKKGFFIYDGTKAIPFSIEVDSILEKMIVNHGIGLSNGDFALGTKKGGLIVIDYQGHLKHRFDKSYGLQDDNIRYVFQDKQGNLWLCLDKGISKIEYDSPITTHDERSKLMGSVLSVVRHGTNSDLYAGTSKGLFKLALLRKFQSVPGVPGRCWSLCAPGDGIFAATTGGVFFIKKNGVENLFPHQAFVLLKSKKISHRIWCGTGKGLIAINQETNGWKWDQNFKYIHHNIRSIAEDDDGNLWLCDSSGGVVTVEFEDHSQTPGVTAYNKSHGLPEGRVFAAWIAGHMMFNTDKGIFRIDKETKHFVSDTTLGDEFAGGPNSRPVFRIGEDKHKHVWFHSESMNYRGIPVPELKNSFDIIVKSFRRLPAAQVNAIYPDPAGKTTWFAGIDGLIRYDASLKKANKNYFQTLIRKVLINNTLIFDGNQRNINDPSEKNPVTIDYKDRNLSFEIAAPSFGNEKENRFSIFMEGYDNGWSPFSKESKRNYTNLNSGFYSFRVKAKNIFEDVGQEAVFQFKILPPWYWTWWAFFIYGIALIISISFFVRWRSRKLQLEKKKLEHIVQERTKEIQAQKLQLENQTFQLKEQSEKLTEMDKVKSRFFANISHEFRTPLTLIMGPLEKMIAENENLQQKENLGMMLRNSQRLLRLINQLLDLSRFDSGKMKLQATPDNIIFFLEGVVASFQSLAQQKGFALDFVTEKKDITLYYDSSKIEQVFTNLLMNAAKFTPTGGYVMVTVKELDAPMNLDSIEQHHFLEIDVKDTGVGISKEQLVHVFDRFFQAGVTNRSDQNGTGIGLALVKEVVSLHYGQVDVHSIEGKGTEFIIRLPLGNRHLSPDEIIASPLADKKLAPQRAQRWTDPSSQNDTLAKDLNNLSQDEDENKRDKPLVLVVEDNVDVRKYVRGALDEHYTVFEAADGQEGIDLAKEIIPDLIVSDVMMPKIDGIELCNTLKRNIKTSHIPIILLTAKASEESQIKGLETGADDYVTKPFNTKILLTRIKNLIGLRQQLQQKIQNQMLLQPVEISVSSMDQEFIKELQDMIEANLSNFDFNVNLMSKKLYMDRTTIYRKIMALTGETPTQFIRSYRLKRAAQLLRDKFGNVSEISLKVGISNLSYFTKCFKEKFQQLPSQYQQN
jgi:signal transduction histidine kinase/DNA-binding response OmpR family regulator